MCGILGITEKNEALVRAAAKTMAHRGPDAFGIFSDDNVTLGHNRLSIIDLDARSNQPMHAGGCSIVFNGEIYNFRELKSELQNLGCSFKTGSD
ncbi:MAG: Asparagine synthetase, partial [Candidatus Adlerbacteria bacterium GW2011_GWB1_54_7]